MKAFAHKTKLLFLSLLTAVTFSTSCNASKNGADKVEPSHPVETESFTIQFKWHNGESNPETVTRGNMPTIPSDPADYEDDGYTYTFSSWSPAVSIATEDKVYNAIYTCTAKEFNITFDADNGTTPTTQKLKYGAYPTAPTNPVKADDDTYRYTFARWLPAISEVKGDQTYVAQYNKALINEATISVTCSGCSVNGKTSFTEKASIGTNKLYHFDLPSSAPQSDYPENIDFVVNEQISNAYTYNKETGNLSFNVTGDTDIQVDTDNCTVKMTYRYDPNYNLVGFFKTGNLTKVDWGDGYKNSYSSHTYTKPSPEGVYTIRVYGDLTELYLNASSGQPGSKGNMKIESVKMYRSITSLPNCSFGNCCALTSVSLPNTITSIGGGAFTSCSLLTSINIPNGVTSIGSGAFGGCSSLTHLTIPNSVVSIGSNAFSGCDSLIYNEDANAKYLGNHENPYLVLIAAKDKSVVSFNIGEGVRFIYSQAFSNCFSLTSINIPNGIFSIMYYAFINCSKLTEITIPNTVLDIQQLAFAGCFKLKTVNFEEGSKLKTIGNAAFEGCAFTSFVIPATVEKIDTNPFNGCLSLSSFSVEPDNKIYDSRENCNAIIETTTNKIISGCKGTIIPSSVVEIKSRAFEETGVTSIFIPNSVTFMKDRVFARCANLKTVDLSSLDHVIDGSIQMFDDCHESLQIKVPSSLLESYQTAPYWSVYASKMIGV